MEEILGLLGNVATGGIFGLIGSIIGVGAKYLQERQRQAWEEKKWSHEETMHQLNMQARAAETEQELAIVAQQGSWSGLEASHQSVVPHSSVHRWVNDIRALFRPALTVALIAIAATFFYRITGMLEGGQENSWLATVFSEAELHSIIVYMVHTIFFTASAAALWWFGDRAMTPSSMKSR